MLEDMLRACVLDHKGNWDEQLPLVEFSTTTVIRRVYKWLHMRHCMGGHVNYGYDWTEVEDGSITGPDLIRDTSEKVSLIRQRLLTA